MWGAWLTTCQIRADDEACGVQSRGVTDGQTEIVHDGVTKLTYEILCDLVTPREASGSCNLKMGQPHPAQANTVNEGHDGPKDSGPC